MLSVYNELLQKLDKFIRKYYTDLLIKGLLWFVSGFSAVFLVLVLLEYFGYFNTLTRALLFFGFLLFNAIILILFVVRPIAGILKLGKRISPGDAAKIIGKHFKNEVDDKITNTLQLKSYLDDNPSKAELLIAGIEQKSRNLKELPFGMAIDFRLNMKYVPYAAVLALIVASGWFLFPYIFKESAGRIIRYEQTFERPAPFQLILKNEQPLRAIKNERFKLQIKTEGNVIPSHLDIAFRSTVQRMAQSGRNEFEYEFRSVNEPIQFFISSGDFNFGPYLLDVKSKAVIKNFTIVAEYPDYTGIPAENFINIGDIEVPEGTNLKWEIFTEDTDDIYFLRGDEKITPDKVRSNVYEYKIIALEDFRYGIVTENAESGTGDSLGYFVNTQPDMFPTISIQEFQDSVMISHLFFEGLIRDDYGFTDLSFFYRVFDTRQDNKNGDDIENFVRKQLGFEKNNLNQVFYHHLNLNTIALQPGQTVEYFFQVTDNDRINGPKSSRSRIYTLSIPTHEQLIAESLEGDEQIMSGLGQSREEINNIQREIDQLRRSMLESDRITWEQQESLRQLLDKQKQAQETYEQLKEFTESKSIKEQQLREQDENILKKQEQLQKLFEEVLTDEMKQLYDQIQEELEKLNREGVFEMLDRFQFEMQDLERRLDRALELFKQLQVERMLTESIDALERLKDRQDELSENNIPGSDLDSIKEEQEDINQNFENIESLFEDMMQKNQELVRPNDFEDTSSLWEEVKGLMDEILNQLNRGDQSASQQGQNESSQRMDDLNQRLQNMLSQMQQQNLAEDIRSLREILDNLIKTSFAQEELLLNVREINVRDPKYVNLIQEQRKISNDLTMIQDSLNALAKRQIQIQSYVTREIAEINMNIDQAIDHLINRRKHTGSSRQQFVMTHVNNLALLLNESMQNMQMQMQMQAEGGGDDPQPGEGMPSFKDLRQMQEQMNQMLDQLREGHQPMPGESGQEGMSMSEQLARMAAEQEAIRNRLNELANQLRSDGENTRELDQTMREMERTELDIVTNNVSRQTQLRQQRILTRLLEHERAHMEREQEQRRVGETAKSWDLSNPEDFFEYNRIKNRSIEMLRSLPPGFKPHYRSLVESYFLNVEQ
ncbi:MAG: hypothetical protein EA393_16885 [Bacteroidetes bacterium]|nr:MAG: hypothetical protein EA393_16885 [Bacteroidota bacterium]